MATGGHGGSPVANTSLYLWLDYYSTAATSRHQVRSTLRLLDGSGTYLDVVWQRRVALTNESLSSLRGL